MKKRKSTDLNPEPVYCETAVVATEHCSFSIIFLVIFKYTMIAPKES